MTLQNSGRYDRCDFTDIDFTEYSWFEAGRGKQKIRAKRHQSLFTSCHWQGSVNAFTAIISCSVCHFVHTMTGWKSETWSQPPTYWQTTWTFSLCTHKVAKQLFLPDNQHLNPKRWSGFIYYVFAAHYCVTVYICHLSICSCESLKYWTSLSPKWTKSVWCACFEVHLLFLMADHAQKPSQSCPSNTLTLAVFQYRSNKQGPSHQGCLVYSYNPCREKLKVRIH